MYDTYQEQSKYDNGVGDTLTKSLRVNFIRKVFSIVGIQLFATCLVVYGAMNSSVFAEVCAILYIPSIIGLLVTGIWLVVSRSASRSFPKNYILLSTFTVSEAIGVALTCLAYAEQQIVFQAFLITAGVVIALTVYALLTKEDFTYAGGTLCLLSFLSFGSAIWFLFFRNETAYLVYSAVGAVIFGYYLIYDVQVIMGDKKLQLSIDDYILGAIMLYVDIIKIFLRILKLLEKLDNDKKKK